jgi:anti-sigma regulatory factor (Ser/Thr protein kinase)
MLTRSEELDLAHDPASPRTARRFVTKLLDEWGVAGDAVERSQLLVSELVSNAVLHAMGPVLLTVSLRDGHLRIEVVNHGAGTPRKRNATAADLSGRGLQLVDKLATGWGSTVDGGRTRVWFELQAKTA